MNKCTVRYIAEDDTIHKVHSGRVVKKNNNNIIIHPNKNNINSLNISKNDSTGKMFTESDLYYENIVPIKVYGYKFWDFPSEIQLQIKKQNRPSNLSGSNYLLNIHGSIDTSRSIVNRNEFTLEINHEMRIKIENLDSSIKINNKDKNLHYNIEKSANSLDMDGIFVNIGSRLSDLRDIKII